MTYPRSDERGFVIYGVLHDDYEADIRVKESSADPLDRCWLFIEGGNLTANKGAAHLTVKQAKALVQVLERFIDHKGNVPRDAAREHTG